MSEYQYYEFLAVDRALTKRQMAEVREWSTRAEITATSFVNEYQWGDFKGDPVEFMMKFYDVHIYWANWGTRRVMLGLDAGLVDEKAARGACGKDAVWAKKGRMVLEAWSEDEEGEYEEMGEPWAGAMVQLRNELAGGDGRGLYLMWLARVQAGDVKDGEKEPVDAAGLGKLTGAQKALAGFLRIDMGLLEAAQRGREAGVTVDEKTWVKWVAELPGKEKDGVLREVVARGAAGPALELRRRFEREVRGGMRVKDEKRTAGELRREAKF